MRDRAALESAWARPQSGYDTDIIPEAAALLLGVGESLSQNHPFVDGNKRDAVTVIAGFLKVNRYRLPFNDGETFSFRMRLPRHRRQ